MTAAPYRPPAYQRPRGPRQQRTRFPLGKGYGEAVGDTSKSVEGTLARRIADLPSLKVDKVAATMRIGVGIIGRDALTDTEFDLYHATAQQLAKKAGAKDGEPNWKEWDHLQMHYLLKRDVFLTWERSIQLIREHMESRFGIFVMSPEEYLEQRDKQAR